MTVSCTLNHDKGCSAFSFVLVVYALFLFFQIMLATNSWKGFQQFSSINVYEALDVMFKSMANSSIKAYIRAIRKLVDWSKSRHFNLVFLLVLFLYICLKFSSLVLLVPL